MVKRIKLIIYLEGGSIESIEASKDFDAIVYDLDVEGISDEELGLTLDGRRSMISEWSDIGSEHAVEAYYHGTKELEDLKPVTLKEVEEYLENECSNASGREARIYRKAFEVLRSKKK